MVVEVATTEAVVVTEEMVHQLALVHKVEVVVHHTTTQLIFLILHMKQVVTQQHLKLETLIIHLVSQLVVQEIMITTGLLVWVVMVK